MDRGAKGGNAFSRHVLKRFLPTREPVRREESAEN